MEGISPLKYPQHFFSSRFRYRSSAAESTSNFIVLVHLYLLLVSNGLYLHYRTAGLDFYEPRSAAKSTSDFVVVASLP